MAKISKIFVGITKGQESPVYYTREEVMEHDMSISELVARGGVLGYFIDPSCLQHRWLVARCQYNARDPCVQVSCKFAAGNQDQVMQLAVRFKLTVQACLFSIQQFAEGKKLRRPIRWHQKRIKMAAGLQYQLRHYILAWPCHLFPAMECQIVNRTICQMR